MCNDYIGAVLVSIDGVMYNDSTMILNCLRCKKDFKTYYRPQKYCSYECWNIAKRKHFGYICKKCGKGFQGTAGHSNSYCSQGCYWESLKIDPKVYRENRNAYTRKYRKENPSWYKAIKQGRRSLEKNAKGSFTGKEWDKLIKKNEGRCAKCKEKKKLTVDHIKPLSKGGSNYIENIQPLCIGCNSRKKDKDIVWSA